MSENEEVDMKSRKEQLNDKRKPVNKKQKNENADENSNAFPNFSVLSKEERLAFFKALSTARRNAEKRGLPTRKRFGTVHDEYLKYFNQNEKDEEEAKQEDNRFTLGIQSEDPIVLSENSILSLEKTTETPQKTFSSAKIENKAVEPPESIIEAETNKLVNLFLKKKKRYERLKSCGTASGNEIVETIGKEKSFVSKELKTPQFDALTKEEKEVFFGILEKAHKNAVEKNINREQDILPLDDILKRYQRRDDVAADTQDTLSLGKTKKNLKVTVTVTSKDNERLLSGVRHSRIQKESFANFYPVDVSTDEQDEEDEKFCESDKMNEEKDSEGRHAAKAELCQISPGSLESSLRNFRQPPTQNSDENLSVAVQSEQGTLSFCLFEQEGKNPERAEEVEDRSVPTGEKEIKPQSSFVDGTSKEVEPEKKVPEVCCDSQVLKNLEENEKKSKSEDDLNKICFEEVGKSSSEERNLPSIRVMLVNDDVVKKLKKLIYYLETKVKKDCHLEEEYLKLLVDYSAYLSKVLESLILKEKAQKKQLKNKCVAAGFGLYRDHLKTEFLGNSAKAKTSRPIGEFGEGGRATSKDRKSELILPVLSDSENSSGSEGETRITHEKGGTEKILRTKIRMLQDLLQQRAEFVEGTFGDVKIVRTLPNTSLHEGKPSVVQLLTEDEANANKENKRKFLKVLIECCRCGRVEKLSEEEEMKKKDASSEAMKANERKKIIERYFGYE